MWIFLKNSQNIYSSGQLRRESQRQGLERMKREECILYQRHPSFRQSAANRQDKQSLIYISSDYTSFLFNTNCIYSFIEEVYCSIEVLRNGRLWGISVLLEKSTSLLMKTLVLALLIVFSFSALLPASTTAVLAASLSSTKPSTTSLANQTKATITPKKAGTKPKPQVSNLTSSLKQTVTVEPLTQSKKTTICRAGSSMKDISKQIIDVLKLQLSNLAVGKKMQLLYCKTTWESTWKSQFTKENTSNLFIYASNKGLIEININQTSIGDTPKNSKIFSEVTRAEFTNLV